MERELPFMPDEIIDNILLRLPVKSLLRFKCVSKRWLSTISDPNFHHKKEYESILLVELSKTLTTTVSLYSIDDDDSKVVKESFSLLCDSTITSVSNSCNGLFIIRSRDSYFLFNPSTRYFAKVLRCVPGFDNIVGLCYDAYTKDYKVVVQLRHYGWNRVKFVVVAASLKSNRWDPVGFPFDAASACEGPILNERLHWTVEHKKIVRYDPRANVFEEFPSPTGNTSSILCLGVSGGCLCMARQDSERYVKEKFEVQTMKEYGVGESWTTLFFVVSSDFQPFLFTKNCEVFLKKSVRKFWSSNLLRKRKSWSSNSSLSLLTKNGEILLGKENMSRKLFAYNWRKNTTTDLDMVSNENWWGAVSFVQNLTSPVGYEWDEELHTESIQTIIERWQIMNG